MERSILTLPLDTTAGPAISACEWVFGDRPRTDVLALLGASGCGGIEIAGEPERPDRAALPSLLADSDVRATGITATCRWPTTERDLTHSATEARERAVAYYRGCVDLAVETGAPAVGVIPVSVGRLEPLTSQQREWQHAIEGVREIAHYAGERGVTVAIEAINRYESYLVCTAEHAGALAAEAGLPNVAVILDAFHMSIEEERPEAAVEALGPPLAALHLADSNRLGLGRGHADWQSSVRAALARGFNGPFTLEFTAPGPNPFSPQKPPEAMAMLDAYLVESAAALQALLEPAPATA